MQTAKQLAHRQRSVHKRKNVHNLQLIPHRPVATKRRLVWRPVNRVQEWLESGDKLPAKAVAYGLLAIATVYLVGQVVRWVA